MKFRAEIDVMPHDNLLDPQGKAVSTNMVNVGLSEIGNVRIGKHIRLELEAGSKSEAENLVQQACKKILANEIMEIYSFELEEA